MITTTEQAAPMGKTRRLAYTALFAALLAICSWLAIPATVPFTLQTLGVFLTMGLLGGRQGTGAVLVYICLAAIGLPVLSGFRGGLGALLGTTGGYVLGFLFTGLIVWGMEARWGRSLWVLGLSLVWGMVVCYAFGTAWYLFLYTHTQGAVSLNVVLGWCVYPFILPDLGKLALALYLTKRLRRFVR